MDQPLVEVEAEVEANAESVWRALTAEKSAMFMGADVDTDWREGSPIALNGEYNGKPFQDQGGERPDDQTVAKFKLNWQMMIDALKKAAEQEEVVG